MTNTTKETLTPYSEFFKIPIEDIRSKCRKQKIVDVRKIISFNLRQSRMKLSEISTILNKDHSTIMYHLKSYAELSENNKEFKNIVEKWRNQNKTSE